VETDEWWRLARKLDWQPSYVGNEELFPDDMCGTPKLDGDAWARWREPYRTSYAEYVHGQNDKEHALDAVHASVGRLADVARLDRGWLNAQKLHAAVLPLAEFTAVVGNLRAARFGRDGAWRTAALHGALDEMRHTQIPLHLMHDLIRVDAQFDWTHRLYHSNNWVAIAARHAFDELLLTANPMELAIGTNFVFETGFTNLQFIGLSALCDHLGDRNLEAMLTSIQTDEARHAQIGRAVLEIVVQHDREYAQYMVDKWFWRSWLLFSIVTGFSMDYLAPVRRRGPSFAEFVEEWVVEQFLEQLRELGLERPWYWDTFLRSTRNYHHMVYASAYTYRASVWFDFVLPGPDERAWLRRKYPDTWEAYEPVWDRITEAWRSTDPGVDLAVHGTAIPTFCALCQIILAHGTPSENDARVCEHGGQRYVLCSEPCQWIFEREPERYASHKDAVRRVLTGEAPANLSEFLTDYCGLSYDVWGKDAFAGVYPWLVRDR
jgi:toluene monooxygenase system protein A